MKRDFQGNETILHNTTMVDTCYYTTSVKTHRMCNTKSEQDRKPCSLGDDDVSVYVHRNKCTTLLSMLTWRRL